MTMHSDVATVPGWYGKLPSLGDFASRRLESDFIEPWDLWLGERMQGQREAVGDAWLQTYRQSPPWRFVLAPGALPGTAQGLVFAGVLIASVDRVGRHFPLTIAASLPRVPKAPAEVEALLTWLHRLEDTALDAVQGHWSIDDLEHALADLAPPSDALAAAAQERLAAVGRAVVSALAVGGGFVEIESVGSRGEFAAGFASAFGESPATAAASASTTSRWGASPATQRRAVWIAEPSGHPQLLVSEGLPDRDDFARMFDGGQAAPWAPSMPSMPSPASMPIEASAALAAVHTTIPDDADLLGMFDAVAVPKEPLGAAVFAAQAPAPSPAPEAADIFALLDAGASAARNAEAASPAPATNDDILAMFDVDADMPPKPLADAGAPREPDLLDLFADVPAAPAPGKTD